MFSSISCTLNGRVGLDSALSTQFQCSELYELDTRVFNWKGLFREEPRFEDLRYSRISHFR